MSLDQAALQEIADRMRVRLRELDENRARRQKSDFVFGRDGDDWSSIGQNHSAAVAVASVAPREHEPPKGKAPRAIHGLRGMPPRKDDPAGGGGKATAAARISAGYQPAVLKVISYGHGSTRATAIGQYVLKDGVELETHDGRRLSGKAMVADEMQAWAKDFDKRRPSDDVATFRLSIAGETDDERLTQAVEAAFAGHGFAYRIDREADGSAEIRVVATMAGKSVVRGENGDETIKHRFHMADKRGRGGAFSPPTRARIAERVATALDVPEAAVTVSPYGEASHGKAGVLFQLSRLTHGGAATIEDGTRLISPEQARQVARGWSKSLNSYEPRDVMHMILSAKAGQDKEALVRAARGFLHEQFPDHKFAFALHDDVEAAQGHFHVHAIVAVKGENGQRLRPGPADLRAWRSLYAVHAQAEGMNIVATTAAYRASSQSYGPRDKAIISAAENPRQGREARDRAYAHANPHVIAQARRRIDRAKADPIRVPLTARQLQATSAALADWQAVQAAQPSNAIANHYIDRMTKAQDSGRVVVNIREGKGLKMRSDATSTEMRENLRDINETVAKTAAIMNGPSKTEFLRRAGETMELLAIRTDLKAMEESGVTRITEEEAHRIAGPRAGALLARAQEIEAAERLEADRAAEIRNRVVEREQRDERSGNADPASLEQVAEDRAMVRDAETIAARERREADAAARIARDLAANPDQRIDANNVQSERLQELQRQQKHDIDTKPVEGEEADSHKPQRQ